MKLNTQILKGLKTLNESFQGKNLMDTISSILDTQSTTYLGKPGKTELLTVPFIGLYNENGEFYEQQGISPNQVVKADKAIKQAIIKYFKEFGKIDSNEIECSYFESSKGKFKFKKVPGKFSIYAKFEIQVAEDFIIALDISNESKDTANIYFIIRGVRIASDEPADDNLKIFCDGAKKAIHFVEAYK